MKNLVDRLNASRTTAALLFVLLTVVAALMAFIQNYSRINLWASNINSQTLEFYKAVGTVLVAVIAACIAGGIQYRQWQTAHKQWQVAQQKLNLERFEKRFAVYAAVYDLQDRLIWKGDTDAAKVDYFAAIRQSQWLFDEEIYNYLIGKYPDDVLAMAYGINEMRGDVIRSALYRAKMASFEKWSFEEHKIIQEKFKPFLTIDKT